MVGKYSAENHLDFNCEVSPLFCCCCFLSLSVIHTAAVFPQMRWRIEKRLEKDKEKKLIQTRKCKNIFHAVCACPIKYRLD